LQPIRISDRDSNLGHRYLLAVGLSFGQSGQVLVRDLVFRALVVDRNIGHAPPLADLNDQRHFGAHRRFLDREGAVRPRHGARQWLALRRYASPARIPRALWNRRNLVEIVGNVNDRTIDGICGSGVIDCAGDGCPDVFVRTVGKIARPPDRIGAVARSERRPRTSRARAGVEVDADDSTTATASRDATTSATVASWQCFDLRGARDREHKRCACPK